MINNPKMAISHGFHVVLWLQWDLENFGAVDDFLKAGCGDGLPSDSMDLIKGMRLEDTFISCTDEDLQAKWLLSSISM